MHSPKVTTAPLDGAPDYASWHPDFANVDVVVQVRNSLIRAIQWLAGQEVSFPVP